MIHKYSLNGFYIVLDVYSGSVHAVDRLVYDLLDLYEGRTVDELVTVMAAKGYDAAAVREGCAEIQALAAEGRLFSADTFAGAGEAPAIDRKPVVKALCLHIAHDCNLKCAYCFAGEGEYHGARSLMPFSVGKKAVDFLIANSGNRQNLEVDFFGGEPTLNFDVVRQIVTYAREREQESNKRFRFTLTTNGVLLDDEKMAYINKEMQNVVLSIDGRKAINDAMRKRAGGQGSYDVIVPKFQQLAESRNQERYYVRGTFTRHNLDFSNDVLHLADLGFRQISVEPVVGEPEKDYTIRLTDLPVLFREYERLAERMAQRKKEGRPFQFFHFMIDLSGGPCVAKRLSGCGAGTEYLAVTPEGDLYPCHQFTGIDAFKMGDLDGGVRRADLRAWFERCTVYAKEDCRACWAKFYCSGGCAANAFMANGDLTQPYALGCELQRKRTECAIMIQAAEMLP